MESDAASVVTLDNGTTIYRDGSGNVTLAEDNKGNVIPIAGLSGSGVVQQFANLLNYWGTAAVNAKYVQPAATTATVASTSAATSQITSLLLFGAIALVAYHTLAK